jgi:hypothetical protein
VQPHCNNVPYVAQDGQLPLPKQSTGNALRVLEAKALTGTSRPITDRRRG